VNRIFLALSGVLMPGLAYAHAGHGVIDAQNVAAHQLIEPLHVILWIVLAAGIVGFAFLEVRQKREKISCR